MAGLYAAGGLAVVPQGTSPAPKPAQAAAGSSLALVGQFLRLRAFGTDQQARDFIADESLKLGLGEAPQVQTIRALDALFSQALPEERVELGTYLEQICAAIQPLVSSAGAAKLLCECDAGCEVRTDAVPLLGLIVSEIILNAARHAHPAAVAGRIDVGCRLEGGHLFVEVADDGIGLPDDFAAEGGRLGLEMVRVLSKRLDAMPLFLSDPLGLQFLLRLPN